MKACHRRHGRSGCIPAATSSASKPHRRLRRNRWPGGNSAHRGCTGHFRGRPGRVGPALGIPLPEAVGGGRPKGERVFKPPMRGVSGTGRVVVCVPVVCTPCFFVNFPLVCGYVLVWQPPSRCSACNFVAFCISRKRQVLESEGNLIRWLANVLSIVSLALCCGLCVCVCVLCVCFFTSVALI